MSLNKPVPMSPVSDFRGHENENPDHEPLMPFAQPEPSRSEPSTLPWWVETDYLPPYVQNFIEANVGLCLVCTSQLFFALMNVTVKYFLSNTDISIPSLILVRQGMTSFGCIVALYYMNDPNPILGPPEIRRMLIPRGLVGTGGLVSSYESFKSLSVSDTTAIQFLTPTCMMMLGFLLLKERPTRRELVSGALCLGGVMLVSRPPFIFGHLAEDDEIDVPAGRVNLPGHGDENLPIPPARAVGVAWAFVSVACASSAYLLIRAIGKRAHALHSMAYFSYTCCVISLPIVLFVPGQGYMPNTLKELFFIILIGVFGFCGQTFVTLGLQREKAGRAGLAIYTSVFFAIILELFIFHTLPSFLSLVGVSIILTSAAWVAVQKKTPDVTPRDEESLSVSRATSPLPSPNLGPTRRGEHYSYSTVPAEEETYFNAPSGDGKGQSGSTLSVPRNAGSN